MKRLLLLAITIPLIYACTKEEKSNTEIKPETSISNSAEAVNQIVIKAQEDMTFDKTEFVVNSGEEITLTLVNVGTSSKEAMGHNLVILKKGTNLSDFLFAASSAKENEYIPKEKSTDILAYTKLLGPKENDQIKFTFDEKGTYEFVCTFPGHAGTMKGTITVI